jgi:hypothetical protein
MKTIERILNYHLSEDQRDCLYEAGIINGCGGEWAFSFDIFLKKNVEILDIFLVEKKQELLCDLRRICEEHDLDYFFKKWFTKSNIIMAIKVFKLLHWIPRFKRFAICVTLTILLQRKWKVFYNK